MGKTLLPLRVYLGLQQIRATGQVDMLDRDAVVKAATAMGHPMVARWVRQNPERYLAGMRDGFAPPRGDQPPTLTDEDERILDRIWDRIAAERAGRGDQGTSDPTSRPPSDGDGR